MANHTLTSLFTDIANAIRNKSKTSNEIIADNFPEAIAGIPMEMGIITLSSTASSITINHSLGVTPNIVIIGSTNTSTSYTNRAFMVRGVMRSLRGTTTAPTSVTFTVNSSQVIIPCVSGYNWYTGTYRYMIGYMS